jgi:hypothetical protein
MITRDPTHFSWEEQNEAIDSARVAFNMDKMAMALAKQGTAAAAWNTIFQQPGGKTWNNVKIAIKVSALRTNNMPKLSIIAKLCKELQVLGVQPGNIIIFDSGMKNRLNTGILSGNNINTYKTAYSLGKLPAGIQAKYNMGGETDITLKTGDTCPCVTWLADGTIDMLINIAINKGHNLLALGGYTLTFKNHVGTMHFGREPITSRKYVHPSAEQLIAMNSSNEILGGTPPRQQLCIVDSLWASKLGPGAAPDTRTNSLVMGTFSHAVDYATIKLIREKLMTDIVPITHSVVSQYWEAFGYDPGNLQMDYVNALTFT